MPPASTPELASGISTFAWGPFIGFETAQPVDRTGLSPASMTIPSWTSSTRKTDSSGTTSYLLDGMSIVAQYAPDGARQAWYTQSLARIDEVLSVVNSQGKHWYQADALGSIYTLTTAAGDVRARGGYDVFGAPVAEYGQAVGQPFGFTGREHELEAGLVYARARYLQPGTGRWTSADPLGVIAGPNAYAYANASPTIRTDPTGLLAPSPRMKTTLEAYAEQHWVAYLWLLADLGVISTTIVIVAQDLYLAKKKECDDDKNGPIMYYRGLSVRDAKELSTPPFEVYSKMARSGGDIADAIARHTDPSTARAHGLTSRNSPYVGVTLSIQVARDFAKGRNVAPKDLDDAPSGIVVAFITRRPPARPGVVEQQEYLFFWSIGIPGETILPIEQHTPNWP